jgi:hypothetical protein
VISRQCTSTLGRSRLGPITRTPGLAVLVIRANSDVSPSPRDRRRLPPRECRSVRAQTPCRYDPLRASSGRVGSIWLIASFRSRKAEWRSPCRSNTSATKISSCRMALFVSLRRGGRTRHRGRRRSGDRRQRRTRGDPGASRGLFAMNPVRDHNVTPEAPSSRRRRGWLEHGNPPGDLSAVARCGAKTRRASACQGPAMRNGQCRMHGGLSTGARTAEGLERSREARWRHGKYSQETRALLAVNRQRWRAPDR